MTVLLTQVINGVAPMCVAWICRRPPSALPSPVYARFCCTTPHGKASDTLALSACETGVGKVCGGEGILGLTRAFLYAGSRSVVELHGSIWKVRCVREGTVEERRTTPLPRIPPVCPSCGGLLRPHVVWFGEPLDPDVLDRAISLTAACRVMLVIGTSAVVQPAASLPLTAARAGAKVIEINVEPTPLTSLADVLLPGKAGEILPLLDERLRRRLGR